MIHFVSISSFRSCLDSLLKVKRGVYAGDRLIAEFKSEMLADSLVEHDINNNLKVIPKSE